MPALTDHLILKVVSEIHDPVTTTDELIPSGETSSYRSNPLGLAEFTLSRKDPAYVGLAKDIQKAQTAVMEGKSAIEAKPELSAVLDAVKRQFSQAADAVKADGSVDEKLRGLGPIRFDGKHADGTAKVQAAGDQKGLSGSKKIANEYTTKRYRYTPSHWDMLPIVIEEGELPFYNHD